MIKPSAPITLHELAEILQSHPRTIKRWIALGILPQPALNLGRKRYWNQEQVTQILAGECDEPRNGGRTSRKR